MPAVYNQLREITTMLENHYRDIQDFEFTIQDGKLYMLQTRNGKRTGPAAVRIAVEMVGEGLIGKKEAMLRVDPQQLDQLLHPVLDPKQHRRSSPCSPRACRPRRAPRSARSSFTAEDAVEASKNGPVILVRKETVPDDIHGMEVAKGILTARGGMTSHAAVVCRGMGTPCVAGAESVTVERAQEVSHRHRRRQDSSPSRKATGSRSMAPPATSIAGKANTIEADPNSRRPRQVHGLGRRVPRQVRRARQRRYPARRQGRAQVRRRRHRPLPHRAHVLRRRPHRAHAGDDSGAR